MNSTSSPASSIPPTQPPRRIRKWSMIWVFSLYMITVVVIAQFATIALGDYILRDSLAAEQQSELAQRASQQVGLVRELRDEQLKALRQIAVDPQFPSPADPAPMSRYLEQAAMKRFSVLVLVSRKGEILAASSDQVEMLDFGSMPWFGDACAGNTGISHLQMISESILAFFFYTPLGVPASQPEYILVGLLYPQEIWNHVDLVKVDSSGYAYMADDHAVLIAHGARDAAGQPTHALVFYAIGSLDDPIIQAANKESLYGEKRIETTAQIPSLARFILDRPPPVLLQNPVANIHRYYFPQQKANKTSIIIPIGAPPDLDTPVSVGANDWVLGITVSDADFLGPLNRLQKTLIVIGIASALLSGLLGLLAAISISRPTRQLANLARQVQNGDYSARSPIQSGDEMGQLASAMNAMLNRLSQAMQVQQAQIATLQRTGEEASSEAVSLSASAEEMASATEQLTSSTELVAQAIQSMAHDAGIQMNQVQQTAQQINSLDQEIVRIAGLSNNLNQASSQMRSLASQAEQAIQQAHNLSKRVQTVLRLIEKFGRQTNMLALNATIEAARAGEMGASFVVVAEEVRHLAESSEQALQEIDGLNKAIQQSMDDIQASVGQTGQAVQVVANMAAELSAAAGRQAQSSAELVEITNRLASIAETNAASAEEIASSIEQQSTAFGEISSSSHDLAVLAQKLQTLASQLVDFQQTETEREV